MIVFNHQTRHFQLKQLLTHTISVANPNLQVTKIIHFGKNHKDNLVIKKIFNTKIVHNIIIMIKNVLRQSSNEDQISKEYISKNTSTKSLNLPELVVLSNKTTKLSAATDQVSKTSITNNNTEQLSMKSTF